MKKGLIVSFTLMITGSVLQSDFQLKRALAMIGAYTVFILVIAFVFGVFPKLKPGDVFEKPKIKK